MVGTCVRCQSIAGMMEAQMVSEVNTNEDRSGLRIMRVRAASARGTISISSKVDVGTEIPILLQNPRSYQAGEK